MRKREKQNEFRCEKIFRGFMKGGGKNIKEEIENKFLVTWSVRKNFFVFNFVARNRKQICIRIFLFRS